MNITDKEEYAAAAQRASAISDAPEGSAEAQELAILVAAIRNWDEAHKGENANGVEDASDLTRADDLSFSGLPGNLGKLRKD